MAWPPERTTEIQKQKSLMLISTAVRKWQMKAHARLLTWDFPEHSLLQIAYEAEQN